MSTKGIEQRLEWQCDSDPTRRRHDAIFAILRNLGVNVCRLPNWDPGPAGSLLAGGYYRISMLDANLPGTSLRVIVTQGRVKCTVFYLLSPRLFSLNPINACSDRY